MVYILNNSSDLPQPPPEGYRYWNTVSKYELAKLLPKAKEVFKLKDRNQWYLLLPKDEHFI